MPNGTFPQRAIAVRHSRRLRRLYASAPGEMPALSVPKTPSIGFAIASESEHDCWIIAIAFLFVRVLCDCFKSRRRLEAEILVLRHQLNVLQQRAPRRLYLSWIGGVSCVLERLFGWTIDAECLVDHPRSISVAEFSNGRRKSSSPRVCFHVARPRPAAQSALSSKQQGQGHCAKEPDDNRFNPTGVR